MGLLTDDQIIEINLVEAYLPIIKIMQERWGNVFGPEDDGYEYFRLIQQEMTAKQYELRYEN